MQLYTFIVIPKAPTKKMVHLKIVQGRQRRTPIAHIKVYWRETTLEEVSNTPEDRMSQSRSLSLQLLWHLNRITMNQNDHKECRTLTASSFRFWNSSTGILSPLLALFLVMLPKAHLTSHSRMSGSRWVIIPSLSLAVVYFGIYMFKFTCSCPQNFYWLPTICCCCCCCCC